MNTTTKLTFALTLLALQASCSASSPSSKPECTGRLNISLPSEADISALPQNEYSKAFGKLASTYFLNTFQDNQEEHWTELRYLSRVLVTHPLTDEERRRLGETYSKNQEIAKIHYKKNNIGMTQLRIGNHKGIAWQSSEQNIYLRTFVGNIGFSWSLDPENASLSKTTRQYYDQLIDGVRPRTLFESPDEPGICLPYLFIRDDGKTPHSISMTYRLKDHPDITINLRSKSAAPTPKAGDWARPETVTNEYQTDFYWEQRLNVHKFKTVWHRPFSMRPVKLAGQDGLASFVSIVREEGGETDYLYHAVARGNPDTPEDVPDVRLVVEQKRANAIRKRIKPLDQDEVLELAETVAASIKSRTQGLALKATQDNN